MRRAVRIGITGKLGSGKSTLAAMLEAQGVPVIRSDDLAREMMERDPALRAQLIRILGPKAFEDEKLDRAYIASRIFAGNSQADRGRSRSLRHAVEAAVHPAVTAEVERQFQTQSSGLVNDRSCAIAVESALILQSRFRERFDYIILVDAPDDAAITRAAEAGRLTKADAEARLAEQQYDQIPREEADFIIENSGSKTDFEKKCETLIGVLESLLDREMPEGPLHSDGNE